MEPAAKPADTRGLIAIDVIGEPKAAGMINALPGEIAEPQEVIKRDQGVATFAAKFRREIGGAPGAVGGGRRNGGHTVTRGLTSGSRPRPGMAQRRCSNGWRRWKTAR